MIEQECENCLFSLCVDGNIMEFFMIQVICNKRGELTDKR